MLRRAAATAVYLSILMTGSRAQVIEFEANGLKYQTLTRGGVTVMFAHLPGTVRDHAIMQVAVSNGSDRAYIFRPDDFSFTTADGQVFRAVPAASVVRDLVEKGNRGDVVRLVSAYEAGLYGMARINSTNGYEQRRQAALAEVASTKLKAAAAASAIAFVPSRLKAGESTDGAIFFATSGKALGPGRLRVRSAVGEFEFEPNSD